MKPLAPHDLPPSVDALFRDPPELLTLDNGLTVVFQENRAHPLVSTQVWIKTGSIHEDQYLGSGLSHFLEHMLFKGTTRRGMGAIAREVQQFGGNINAYTAFDRTVYYIDSPAECLDKAIDLLADMTLQAALPESEVQKEKEVILREIDMTLDDPDRILTRAFFQSAFLTHPFRFPVIGIRQLFERVDRDILRNYYQARYQPANMVLTVAGDVDRNHLLDLIDKTFGGAPRGPNKPVILPTENPQLAFRECRLTGDFNSARGLLGFKIPSMRHPDAPGLDILAAILGSGQSGRLRQKLRDNLGFVHSISSSTWNPGNPGLFIASYQCDPEKSSQAEEAIRATFQVYAETGFTEQELEKARRFAFVSEVHGRQTTSGLASRLGLVTTLLGDVNYPRRYFEKIQTITADELKSLAEKVFREDHLTIATLLPKGSEPQAKQPRERVMLPGFQEIVLSNGARLYWQRDGCLPRTWMRFAGTGGCLYEDPEYRGATSLLATVLARDTRYKTAYKVAQDLESQGGFMHDSCGNNTFSLALEVMPEMAETGLLALRDAILEPAFRISTLEREREAQLADLREMEDEILDYGRILLRKQFFGRHPFSTGPLGSLETVRNLDKKYLQCLYNRLIVAPNTVLVVTGNFDPDRLVPKMEAFMNDLPEWHLRSPSFPFDTPACTGEVTETANREQTVLFEAYPDVGFMPETDLVGELLDEILSDMSGPLFHSVREERSLAYYVGASRILGSRYGAFTLYAGTHPAAVETVFGCFDAELDRIRNGLVTDEEIQSARTRLKVHNRFSLQSPSGRAARVAVNALFHKPIMDWVTYEQRMDALTGEDLVRFVNRQLVPEKRLRFKIGPKI